MHLASIVIFSAMWMLNIVTGGLLTNCQSKLHDTGIELEEDGSLTNCFEQKLFRNRSMSVLRFKVNSTLLESKIPFLKTKLDVIENLDAGKNATNQDYMDVIVHTDCRFTDCTPMYWSDGDRFIGKEVEKEIYLSAPLKARDESAFVSFTVFLIPTTDKVVKVNVAAGMKDVSIKLNETRIANLSSLSPLVFKYTYDKEEKKRIRVHIRRSDTAVKDVTSGCTMVTIQSLTERINRIEDGKTSKNPWQTMLGQSIIDVKVGKRGKGKLKRKFKNGFQVVIRASPEQNCHVKNVSPNLFQDGEIGLSIEVRELDNDVKRLSIIIGGVMVVLIALFVVVEFFLGSVCKWTSLSGKVIEKDATSSESSESSESSDDNSSISEIDTCLDEENPSREEEDCDHRDETDGRDIKVHRNCKKVKTMKSGRSKYRDIQSPNFNHRFLDEDGYDHGDEIDGKNDGYSDRRLGLLKERVGHKLNAAKQRKEKFGIKDNEGTKETKTKLKDLRLHDLSTKCDVVLFLKHLDMKSSLYCWIMVLSGIFYILPTIQLMFGAQEISKHTGSQDLCYYNFLCRYEVRVPFFGRIKDWGNVFSNSAYLFSGIIFILAVWRRRQRRREEMVELYERSKTKGKKPNPYDKTETIKQRIRRYENDEISIEFLNRRGIPEQYGIFYAMGGATIFEGLLSTCYHVCPAHESFQFDTTFMYILAVLIFVKFYQFRHPDITADAYLVFLIIGLSLIMETISYYSPPGYYLPIFVAMYLIIMLSMVMSMYLKLYNLKARTLYQALTEKIKCKCKCICCGKNQPSDAKSSQLHVGNWKRNWKKPGYRCRSGFFMFVLIANFIIAVWQASRVWDARLTKKDGAVSNVLLLVFGMNMVLYVTYYIIMKNYYAYRRSVVSRLPLICRRTSPEKDASPCGDQKEKDESESASRSYEAKVENSHGDKKAKESNEKITWYCWLYFFLALIFLVSSLHFFEIQERTTTVTAAQSRNMNQVCTLKIFDAHDIWHFLSALGILFTLLTVLTIEDNNTTTPWSKLHVF